MRISKGIKQLGIASLITFVGTMMVQYMQMYRIESTATVFCLFLSFIVLPMLYFSYAIFINLGKKNG